MKKLFFVITLLGALSISSQSFAQTNTQAVVEQQEVIDEPLDPIVYEAYLKVISEMESDCECSLDEAEALSCSQIARLIGVAVRNFTDLDKEIIDKIETAIEEICEILREEN